MRELFFQFMEVCVYATVFAFLFISVWNLKCIHLPTKVIQSKFAHEITEGWGMLHPTPPAGYTPDFQPTFSIISYTPDLQYTFRLFPTIIKNRSLPFIHVSPGFEIKPYFTKVKIW